MLEPYCARICRCPYHARRLNVSVLWISLALAPERHVNVRNMLVQHDT